MRLSQLSLPRALKAPLRCLQGRIIPDALGITGGAPFFISVAAVDAAGHESLFAYPE